MWLCRRAGNFWQPANPFHDLRLQRCRVHTQLGQNGHNNTFAVMQQRGEQVQRKHLWIAVLARQLICLLDRFLRLDREFVPPNCHIVLLKFLVKEILRFAQDFAWRLKRRQIGSTCPNELP
jgi:hypothetical protein